ncbi:MAG: tetratricopeptide repeat-containing sensor histidine kinase [Chloroherpetonaceae bacterium]|nr:tetratricopeptide repeat-containing sensor histidine kinase [Chloroherpetonaceae bacterium]
MSHVQRAPSFRQAESLCEEASRRFVSEPKEALALLLKAESLLATERSDDPDCLRLFYRCWSLQSAAYQRLSEFDCSRDAAMRAYSIAKKTRDDKGVANVMRLLGNIALYKGDYKEAVRLYEKGLECAEKAGDQKIIAALLNNVGSAYHQLSDYARALKCFNQCLEIQRQLGERRGIANSFSNIGNVCYSLGDYANAIEHLFKGLKEYQAIGDEQGESVAHSGLGLVYERLGDYEKAIEHYQNCLRYEEKSGDRKNFALTLNNLGNVYAAMGDCERALDAYSRSLDIKRQIGDRQGVAHTLNNLAELCAKQGRYDDARAALTESLDILRLVGDKSGQALCLITKARLFADPQFARFDLETAIEDLNLAIAIASDINAKATLADAHQLLSAIFEQKGDARQALHHYKLFHALEREIKSEESAKRVQSLTIAYEAEQAKKESELRRLEAEKYRLQNVELAKANQFKTELLAIAAHDLKNPLQSVMGFAQLLSERHDLPEDARSFAQIIRRASERMLALINNLLEDVKTESMNFELNLETVNFSDLIRRSVETQFAAQAAQKSQTIRLRIEENLVVQGDPERLKQIIDNLVSNAIKYSPSGKPIEITAQRREAKPGERATTVLFSVRDEGQGLTEDDMKKLFGKFQRLSAKPTGGESSTGLGLAIAKKLTELHGGKIWAESEGKGATFFVELPMKES